MRNHSLSALVLSGGGAKGAYEAGVASALIRTYGEQFDIVCGTSIGAINGALIAQGDIDGLEKLWHSIAKKNLLVPVEKVKPLTNIYEIFQQQTRDSRILRFAQDVENLEKIFVTLWQLRPLKSLTQITGIFNSKAIAELLQSYLTLVKVRRVLITTATDLTHETANIFYHFPGSYQHQQEAFRRNAPGAINFTEETYVDAIRASAAIPGIFAPVGIRIRDFTSVFVDGGVTNNTPIGQAIDAGATDITVVYVDSPPAPGFMPSSSTTLLEIAVGCFSVMQQRLLLLDFETALRTNDAKRNGRAAGRGKRHVRLRRFYPSSPLSIGIIDFKNQERIDAAFALGVLDAGNDVARLVYER